MIRSLLWRSLLIAIGLLTFGLQLDRQVQRTPAFAESVPEPFRSSAQFPVAAYALASDDAQLALEEAERLIRRRPLPAEHLRILAQAQVAAGSFEDGTLSIQYAAQRGWRDPLAQESMLRLAIMQATRPKQRGAMRPCSFAGTRKMSYWKSWALPFCRNQMV